MLSPYGFHRARNMAGAAAVVAAEERAERATSKLERLKEKSEAATHMVITKAVTAGVAGGLGYWQGYKGAMPELAGFGADLWLGAGFSLAALFADDLGMGKYASYLDSVGTGALAFWAANQGNIAGVAKAEKDTPDLYPGEVKGGFPQKPVTTAGGSEGFAPHVASQVSPDGVPWASHPGYGR